MDNFKWFDDIPSDWKVMKIGSIFTPRNIKVNDTDYPPLSVTKVGIIPQMEGVAKTDANDNRKLVLLNDFVINSRSDRKQSCGVADRDGSVSLINIVLYYDSSIVLPQYANYLLKNYGFAEEFYRWGHGIVSDLWTTRWREMKNISLPIPPLETQRLIVEKIHQIESIIEAKKQTLLELENYKQAVVYEYVTGKKEVV